MMIKQLIPARDVYALYIDKEKDMYFFLTIEFYSLNVEETYNSKEDEDIKAHVFDSDGFFNSVEEDGNFVRLIKSHVKLPLSPIYLKSDELLDYGIEP